MNNRRKRWRVERKEKKVKKRKESKESKEGEASTRPAKNRAQDLKKSTQKEQVLTFFVLRFVYFPTNNPTNRSLLNGFQFVSLIFGWTVRFSLSLVFLVFRALPELLVRQCQRAGKAKRLRSVCLDFWFGNS